MCHPFIDLCFGFASSLGKRIVLLNTRATPVIMVKKRYNIELPYACNAYKPTAGPNTMAILENTANILMPSPLRAAGKTTTARAAITVVANANIAPCNPRSTKIVSSDVVRLNNPIIMKNNMDESNKSRAP